MSDRHLNLFRFYNQNPNNKVVAIENNFVRALALCLRYDYNFYEKFVEKVCKGVGVGSCPKILIQESAQTLANFKFDRIIPITITENKNSVKLVPPESYEEYTSNPICDLIIYVDNVLVICEIRVHNEDCSDKIYNQIRCINVKKQATVDEITNLSWIDIVNVMDSASRVIDDTVLSIDIVKEFLEFISWRYNHFIPKKEFSEINFDAFTQLMKINFRNKIHELAESYNMHAEFEDEFLNVSYLVNDKDFGEDYPRKYNKLSSITEHTHLFENLMYNNIEQEASILGFDVSVIPYIKPYISFSTSRVKDKTTQFLSLYIKDINTAKKTFTYCRRCRIYREKGCNGINEQWTNFSTLDECLGGMLIKKEERSTRKWYQPNNEKIMWHDDGTGLNPRELHTICVYLSAELGFRIKVSDLSRFGLSSEDNVKKFLKDTLIAIHAYAKHLEWNFD